MIAIFASLGYHLNPEQPFKMFRASKKIPVQIFEDFSYSVQYTIQFNLCNFHSRLLSRNYRQLFASALMLINGYIEKKIHINKPFRAKSHKFTPQPLRFSSFFAHL